GSEFVANAQAVANPSIKPLLDVIDIAQRNGSISTLNLENVLLNQTKMQMRGFERGGTLDSTSRQASASNPYQDKETKELLRKVEVTLRSLNNNIKNGITAEVALLGKNGFIEKQKELTNLENR